MLVCDMSSSEHRGQKEVKAGRTVLGGHWSGWGASSVPDQAGSFSPGGVLFEIPPPEVALSPAGLTGQPWGPAPGGRPPPGLALFGAHLPLGWPPAAVELAPAPDALCWAFANLHLYPSTADND